ncbi:hypothetical protein [Jiangella aurantiaca]|uniref:hypothetical protein n=1 Tax=Jiangella aurantiaca TaxID=2530373 RepID=UPI00193C9DB9|nr:hypothetical protein [Jiangella aurantiaca]
MTDTSTLRGLHDRLLRFVADRQWKSFHTPKNLAMAPAGEAGELLDEVEVRYPPGA